MYGVYDYGFVTHAQTHTHTTCDNLPREICDNLPQCHFYLQQDYHHHVWDIDIVD